MKITRRQLIRIVNEAMEGGGVSLEVLDAVAAIISDKPGISGQEIVFKMQPTDTAKIYRALDELLEDDEVVFDVEEDEWYLNDRGDYYDYMRGFKS